MVIEGSQRTITETEESGVDVALVALDALALYVHLGFGGDDGLDIVGFRQGIHVQVIINHKQTIFKVSAGKTAGLDLLDTAVAGGIAQQVLQHQTNARFALTALADQEHHLLPLGAGNEAVAQIFLQGGDVLRLQQLIQKGKPAFRLGGFGIIGYRQTVPAKQAAFLKSTVRKVVNAVFEVDCIHLNIQRS